MRDPVLITHHGDQPAALNGRNSVTPRSPDNV